jgi:uncharacterized protein involved in exopolysaccharide biosynthesis
LESDLLLLRVPVADESPALFDDGVPMTLADMTLAQSLKIVRNGWYWIALAILCGALAFAAFGLLSRKVYEADVVLLPKDNTQSSQIASQLGSLGGLAGLVGIGSASSKTRDEALAVLRSRAFAARFIERQGIESELAEASAPFYSRSRQKKPNLSELARFFAAKVLVIYDDKKLGTLRITLRWHDPAKSAEWANNIAQQLNADVRERVLDEGAANVEYLKSELAKSQIVTLSQSIGALLEGEIRRQMIARGSADYAFRVIDPAQVPTRPVWPRPMLLAVLGAAIGAVFSFLILLLRALSRLDAKVN